MSKDFTLWHRVKGGIERTTTRVTFNEREIWWCSIGLNIGYEVFGKNNQFSRPVLILRKYSDSTFFGIPLTTQIKSHYSQFHFDFKGVKQGALLDQARTMDAKRLYQPMGTLSENKTNEIIDAFIVHLKN